MEETIIRIHERLAVTETRLNAFEAHMAKAELYQAETLVRLRGISLELTKYKGFIGGVVFVVASLTAFMFKMFAPLSALWTKLFHAG